MNTWSGLLVAAHAGLGNRRVPQLERLRRDLMATSDGPVYSSIKAVRLSFSLGATTAGRSHCSVVVGIEVKADPPNRSPNTPTFPAGTVMRAEPLTPAIPANPRKPRSAASILLPGMRGCEVVPRRFPLLSQAVIV